MIANWSCGSAVTSARQAASIAHAVDSAVQSGPAGSCALTPAKRAAAAPARPKEFFIIIEERWNELVGCSGSR